MTFQITDISSIFLHLLFRHVSDPVDHLTYVLILEKIENLDMEGSLMVTWFHLHYIF
jgi:hypothetical protein